MFDPPIYADRRQRLQGLVDGDLVLLLGNDESPMNYPGNVYPIRQDSTFLYFLGLDVHDMEDLGEDFVGYAGRPRSNQFGLKWLRLARQLEPGFVLTVEPGIYFIPSLIDRWRAEGRFADFIAYEAVAGFRDFGGIRIEEDFLITEQGGRLLGEPAPKSVAEVESVRSGVAKPQN